MCISKVPSSETPREIRQNASTGSNGAKIKTNTRIKVYKFTRHCFILGLGFEYEYYAHKKILQKLI